MLGSRMLGVLLAAAAFASATGAGAQTVSNFAGVGLGDGGPATGASLVQIRTVNLDAAGNMYLVDVANFRIRRVDASTGIITTFAGVGSVNSVGAEGDGGPANQASLNQPYQVIFDTAGNAYISDRFNHRIRRVDAATGIITTFAGTGVAGSGGDGGPAISAQFNAPAGLAFDGSGNLYVSNSFNHRIRRIDATTGVVTSIAGTGTAGFSGDGGAATSAQLNAPNALLFGPGGDLYVSDINNNRIRKISMSTGIISTVAGNGTVGFSGDGAAATLAAFNQIGGFDFDAVGNMYIADRFNHRIRKVDAVSGNVTTFAGTGIGGYSGDGGAAATAQFLQPFWVKVDAAGSLLVSDSFNHRIRRIDSTTQTITTVAGAGANDGRPATQTAFINPQGFTKDPAGNLLLADTFNARVARIDRTTGIVTTIAGQGEQTTSGDGGQATAARINRPISAKYDAAGNLYIVERVGNRIRKVDTLGVITTWAGTGVAGYSGDGGPASAATLNNPVDLVLDASGHFFVSDENNHVIRRIDKDTLIITTVAGTGVAGFSGDGSAATLAQLNFPVQMAFDGAGNLHFVDSGNQRVRRINAVSGTVITVAGSGATGFAGDGSPATAAAMNNPVGLAIDSLGNLYVSDGLNGRIRRVNATSGNIVTVFGTGSRLASGSGVSSLAATGEPQFLYLDGDATLYFGDTRNSIARRIDNVNAAVKVQQQITFAALANRAYGTPAFTVGATASSNLAVTFTSTTTAVCTVSGTTVTMLSAGTCTIAANQAGDATWAPAPQVTQSFTVTGLFRAYLSKNGADTNACTLAAPCRLLPAALAAINPGGEIWMLDSANFNASTVTIAKSVTILAVPGALGSIVANGGHALVIQGTATAEVTLRNLVILNLAGAANTGVNFIQGSQLTVEGCEIYGLSIAMDITAAGSLVTVKDTTVRDNLGLGITVRANVIAVLDRVDLVNTRTGLNVAAGAQVQVRESSISGNTSGVLVSNNAAAPVTSVLLSGTVLSGNGTGVQGFSQLNNQVSQVVLDDCVFTGNSTAGVINVNPGVLNVFTRGNNAFRFNGSDFTVVVPQALPPQ